MVSARLILLCGAVYVGLLLAGIDPVAVAIGWIEQQVTSQIGFGFGFVGQL